MQKKFGILTKNELSISGPELDKISDEQLEKDIERYKVFARVSPEHKVKIVNILRKKENVVAMTGDRSK